MSNIKLYSNTINNKNIVIDEITLYNTETKKEIITISKFDAKTNTINSIYNDIQESNINIESLNIADVKRKLKPDYSEKNPFYIVLEHDTKYYNEYRINLYLNQNYYDNLIIKDNEIKKEMQTGCFWFYDNINFIFKNIDIDFSNYTCIFCKDFQETKQYNKSWDAVHDIKEEIQKEKQFIIEYPEYKNNKYINVLNEKLKAGFTCFVWYYKKEFSNNNIKIDIEKLNHIEKNSYRQKIEFILNKYSESNSNKYFSENDLYKLLKILKLDIETVLKNIEV